jgi:hypothetical protein
MAEPAGSPAAGGWARPALCEGAGGEPHPLQWLDGGFALCHGCGLLYASQPGVLVWVYDVWSCRLADCLAAAQLERDMARLGLSPDGLALLCEGHCEGGEPDSPDAGDECDEEE